MTSNTCGDSLDSLKNPLLKRIMGYVEEELSKLSKCLIDIVATISSTSQVLDQLQAWGFGEITKELLGSRSRAFLSIVRTPQPSKELQRPGCPNIKLLTVKKSLLISTKQRGRINEVIEVEAGQEVFLVQVYELGLNMLPKQNSSPLKPQRM
ncbi:hypothetical protein V6N13_004797 [Hibiscus sabdariffa]